MKMEITITEITHDELVSLISTATYGSSFVRVYSKNGEDYRQLKHENDSKEDVYAKILLAGKPIIFADDYAEDECDFYGNLPHTWDNFFGIMEYELTLKDIELGIAEALKNGDWGAKCAMDLINGDGNFDLSEAEYLMQIIVFNEAIYG